MGATLAWVKVIDAERYRLEGEDLRPSLESVVELVDAAPAEAAPFLILRAWTQFEGAFTETWRIRDRYGRTIRGGLPREVIAGEGTPDQGGLIDEIEGQQFEYADDGYQLVLHVEGREVARTDFAVREPSDPRTVQ